MTRIVVEGYQTLGAGQLSERQHVTDRAVSPPNVCQVLVVRVLRVVNEEIRAGGEVVAGRPLRFLRESRCAEGGFVVRDVRHRDFAFHNSVAHGRPRVTDQIGLHLQPADAEPSQRHVVQGQPAGQFPQAHGKERR